MGLSWLQLGMDLPKTDLPAGGFFVSPFCGTDMRRTDLLGGQLVAFVHVWLRPLPA